MQTHRRQKNGEGSRRRSVETKAVETRGGEERDQFETEAGVGFVAAPLCAIHASNASFARLRAAKDFGRHCASVSMISFFAGPLFKRDRLEVIVQKAGVVH